MKLDGGSFHIINTTLTIAIILPLTIANCRVRAGTEIYDSFSQNDTFSCENGEQIALECHNDGEVDCLDSTDEYEDPILFFIASSFNSWKDSIEIDVVGTFIRSKKAFRKRLDGTNPCEDPETLLLLDTHETHIYFLCEGEHQRDRIFYINRSVATFESIWLPGKNIRALAFDQITSNVYLLQNDRIEICDSKFIFCSILQQGSKHQNNSPIRVVGLAFSSEKGLLFWIEEHVTKVEWCVMKSRRDGTRAEIMFTTKGPRDHLVYITIDQSSHRLYCILKGGQKMDRGETSIYSFDLVDGSEKKLFVKDLFSLQTAMAVNRDQLFWRSNRTNALETCIISNNTNTSNMNASMSCSPFHYHVFPSPTPIGKNVMIYSGKESITPEKLGEKCACGYYTHSPCKNLCTYVSSIEPVCFCNNVNGSLRVYYLRDGGSIISEKVLIVAFLLAHRVVPAASF